MNDLDKTMAPHRGTETSGADEVTMPGKRDRKPDGRFAVGDLIMGRYKVLAELGQGGMGVVYKCFDEDAGIEVALKALPPELSHNTLEMEDIKENFQLVHNLHHPNIASSNNLEKDKSNGNYYLIMECCDGEDLRRWLRRKRKEGELKLEDVLPIVKQVADALDYAHKQKIMHRDIKPGNIMINAANEIKVLDFGLAAQIHTSMTRVSMAYHGTSGTGPYMAPEQWEGRIQDAKADQYALAVMTYEMLAGHTPFESTDAAVLREAVLKSKVIPLENIPQSANAAIMRALSKEPSERFESCSDFAAALGGKKISATKVAKAFPRWIAAIVLLVLLGAGGTGYYLFDKQQKEKAKRIEAIRIAAEKAEKAEKERLAKLAAEKAEKERLAKLAAEKAEKERKAKLVEEQLDSENSALKVELTGKIADINQKNYDPAQTFGKKIKEMQTAFAVAQEAKLLRTANREYKRAKKLADWILTNGELREEANKLKLQAENNKKAAEQYDVQTFATKLYTSANSTYTQAVKFYDELNFADAKNSFAESANGFKKAENTAFDNKLQYLREKAQECEKNSKWNELKVWAEKIRPLNSELSDQITEKADNELRKIAVEKKLAPARSAKAEKNWQSVYDHAVAALNIDSDNSEAQSLKQEAENNLIPTLEVIAYVNGKQVSATVRSLKTLPDWNNRPWKLEKGKEYEFDVAYKSGNDEYIGKVPAFACTANGLHRKEVILEKVFTGTVDCNGVALEMVKIKAGTFTMGSPEGELGRDRNEKQHQVTLTRDYWLGKFEVTQAQWQAVMGNNPSFSYYKADNRPVEHVSWNDAKEFCDKLNKKYAGELPAGYKFDLPTEAQWEYACRAGTTTALNNGTDLTSQTGSCSNLHEVGWYEKNCACDPHMAVGLMRPNNWGLYDMHGNVGEWCRDWYTSYSGDATNPMGPSSGSLRVSRGGSWPRNARYCRSAYRCRNSPGLRVYYLGFRLALVPVQ